MTMIKKKNTEKWSELDTHPQLQLELKKKKKNYNLGKSECGLSDLKFNFNHLGYLNISGMKDWMKRWTA